MVFAIVVNTIILGMDHYPIEPSEERWREIVNYVFLVIFVLEFVVKVLGLSWKGYMSNSTNSFDFVVLIISLVEVVISAMDVKI
jgi:hypothetical protein